MRTVGDQQAAILEVTTSVSGRKRGRPPRKPLIKTTEESDTGRVTRRCVGRDESGPAASEVTSRRLTAQWKGRVKSCDIGRAKRRKKSYK